MEKEIKNLIENGFSTREIADALEISQTTLRRHMKKNNLKTNFNPCGKKIHFCPCGETNSEAFYGNDKSQCKKCHSSFVLVKQKANKIKAINYFGGKCNNCNFDKIPALEFHHKDGGENKDRNFSSKFGWSWNRLQKELSKCILVCSNCHKLIHAGILVLKDDGSFL